MTHSFDIEIAQMVGIIPAIIFRHIMFWCMHNESSEMHIHDGESWTYASVKALTDLFPYITTDQIRRALKKLLDCNLIKKGNFNEKAFDRTTWYALTENAKSICDISHLRLCCSPNGSVENPKPIPDISNTDISITDISDDIGIQRKLKRKTFTPPTIEEIEAYALSIDYNLDAQHFFTYYSDRDWKRDGKRMQSWKAAVHTWKHNDERRGIDTHAKVARPAERELTAEQIALLDATIAQNGRDAFM